MLAILIDRDGTRHEVDVPEECLSVSRIRRGNKPLIRSSGDLTAGASLDAILDPFGSEEGRAHHARKLGTPEERGDVRVHYFRIGRDGKAARDFDEGLTNEFREDAGCATS